MKLSRNKTLNILKDHHNCSTKIREGFPGGSLGKNPPVNVGDAGSILGAERSRGRKWQPTPVFLPGKSCGQRSLVGYSPWGHKIFRYDLGSKQQQQIEKKRTYTKKF